MPQPHIRIGAAEFARTHDTRSPPSYSEGDYVVELYGTRTYRVRRIIAPESSDRSRSIPNTNYPNSWYVNVQCMSTGRILPAQFAARFVRITEPVPTLEREPQASEQRQRYTTNHRIGVPKNKLP